MLLERHYWRRRAAMFAFRDLSREGLKRLDKLKVQIAKGNGASIEDTIQFFKFCYYSILTTGFGCRNCLQQEPPH